VVPARRGVGRRPGRRHPSSVVGNKVRGPGLLADVTFIQRLDTTGGLPPTGACVEGTTASVPYTTTYTFWVKA
jgi:Protein of unknown function (DUF3455)